MSIERRDERLGIAKERLKDGTQGRQEGGEVDGTALQDAQEIDPSGKDLSVTDEDECRRGGVAVRLKSSGHGLAALHLSHILYRSRYPIRTRGVRGCPPLSGSLAASVWTRTMPVSGAGRRPLP